MTIDLLVDAKNVLGEGPVWDVTEQRIYWVDIVDRTVQRCSARGDELQTWRVPGDVGAWRYAQGAAPSWRYATGFSRSISRPDHARG